MFLLVALYIYMSFKIQRYYMNLRREVTRLKSISASPIIQQFKEALEGVATIRVYDKREEVFENYLQKVNNYQKNSLVDVGASGWFSVRVALLAMVVILPMVTISVRRIIPMFSIVEFPLVCPFFFKN